MAKYQVGERLIVEGVEWPPDVKYNGMEVVVTKYKGFNPVLPASYQVVFIDTGEISLAAEQYLHRKQPVRGDLDTVVSWETVGWKPNKEEK
jgi:hypothetical protein